MPYPLNYIHSIMINKIQATIIEYWYSILFKSMNVDNF